MLVFWARFFNISIFSFWQNMMKFLLHCFEFFFHGVVSFENQPQLSSTEAFCFSTWQCTSNFLDFPKLGKVSSFNENISIGEKLDWFDKKIDSCSFHSWCTQYWFTCSSRFWNEDNLVALLVYSSFTKVATSMLWRIPVFTCGGSQVSQSERRWRANTDAIRIQCSNTARPMGWND